MKRRREAKGLQSIDWMSFSLFLSLVSVGWLMIFAVGYGEAGYPTAFVDFIKHTAIGKQTIWIGISMAALILIMVIDHKVWSTLAYPIYGIALILLIAVLIFGVTIKNATSWFFIGGFSFQPSEFAKFATCLALASFLSSYNTDLRVFRFQSIAFGIFMIPVFLILLQPDAGSALIFLSFLIVLFREGLSANFYIIILSTIALFIVGVIFNPLYVIITLLSLGLLTFIFNLKNNVLYWLGTMAILSTTSIFAIYNGHIFYAILANVIALLGMSYVLYQKRKIRVVAIMLSALLAGSTFVYSASYVFNNVLKPHQRDRINVWLRPQLCDPQGSLYNLIRSKMAIASGGFQGKGFLNGVMTKLNYVPEQTTDFIFCTVGEEQGFIGSFAIITLFLLLLIRITILAERQRNTFARHYAYGLAGILFFHFLINIGMTMGLMPIIGIPLPFISKGGSSLLMFTIMIAVLLKLDSHRFSS